MINFVPSSIIHYLWLAPLVIDYSIAISYVSNNRFRLESHFFSALSILLSILNHLFLVIVGISLISWIICLCQHNLQVNIQVNLCLSGWCGQDLLVSIRLMRVSITNFDREKGCVVIEFSFFCLIALVACEFSAWLLDKIIISIYWNLYIQPNIQSTSYFRILS